MHAAITQSIARSFFRGFPLCAVALLIPYAWPGLEVSTHYSCVPEFIFYLFPGSPRLPWWVLCLGTGVRMQWSGPDVCVFRQAFVGKTLSSWNCCFAELGLLQKLFCRTLRIVIVIPRPSCLWATTMSFSSDGVSRRVLVSCRKRTSKHFVFLFYLLFRTVLRLLALAQFQEQILKCFLHRRRPSSCCIWGLRRSTFPSHSLSSFLCAFGDLEWRLEPGARSRCDGEICCSSWLFFVCFCFIHGMYARYWMS